MVDRVPERDVQSVGGEHVELVHPLAGVGRHHWEAWKTSAVCDVCYAIVELPCWEHISDPPTHAGNGRDESGQWLLCDTCHTYRVQGRPGPRVRHAYASSTDRAPWVRRLPPDGQLAVRVELVENWNSGNGVIF